MTKIFTSIKQTFLFIKNHFRLSLVILLVIISIFMSGNLWAAAIEANSFNKFQPPGAPKANLIDALFVELRIDANCGNYQLPILKHR
jgi:hypothetical protein